MKDTTNRDEFVANLLDEMLTKAAAFDARNKSLRLGGTATCDAAWCVVDSRCALALKVEGGIIETEFVRPDLCGFGLFSRGRAMRVRDAKLEQNPGGGWQVVPYDELACRAAKHLRNSVADFKAWLD